MKRTFALLILIGATGLGCGKAGQESAALTAARSCSDLVSCQALCKTSYESASTSCVGWRQGTKEGVSACPASFHGTTTCPRPIDWDSCTRTYCTVLFAQ